MGASSSSAKFFMLLLKTKVCVLEKYVSPSTTKTINNIAVDVFFKCNLCNTAQLSRHFASLNIFSEAKCKCNYKCIPQNIETFFRLHIAYLNP